MLTTTNPRRDFDSTAVRLQFDRATTIQRRYYGRPTWLLSAAALRPKLINRSTWQRLAGYVTVTLMTFDKQLNGRRKTVESKSNRSRNHRITQGDSVAKHDELTCYGNNSIHPLVCLCVSIRHTRIYCVDTVRSHQTLESFKQLPFSFLLQTLDLSSSRVNDTLGHTSTPFISVGSYCSCHASSQIINLDV